MGMLNNVYMLRSYTDLDWQGEIPPLEDYEAQGFLRPGAHRWRDHSIPPHMARHYADLGLSPLDAQVWGVIPAIVEAYLEVGVNDVTVVDWVREGFMPHEIPLRSRRKAAPQDDDDTTGHPTSDYEAAEQSDGADREWSDPAQWPDPWAVPDKAPDGRCTVVPLRGRRRFDDELPF